jgi:Predicted oxidoreductases (related to aryl-alcohol dehydrogenases)
MKYNRIGLSDIFAHPIGMGCWAYGGGDYWGDQSQQDVNEIVHMALDKGINLFDTAEMYNNGESERSLGIALKGKRQNAIICSKVSPSNARPATLRRHCENSLKRLETDYLDIYMIHWPINKPAISHFTDDGDLINNPPSVQNAFDTLTQLKKEGKIRYIGISNFGPLQIQEALVTGAEIILNEMPYNILSRAIEADIIPFCMKNNMSIVGSMALQQGLLAGIYQMVEDVPPHQAHSRHFSQERGKGASRHYENGCENEMFETISQIRNLSKELNCSMARLAIAWVLAKQGIACTLVGSRNKEELTDNITIADMTLDPYIISEIDRISLPVLEKLGSNPDYYESSQNSRIW